MTLLITVFAAVLVTALWYRSAPNSQMHIGMLVWMLWGASLMWLVDAIAEYIELGAEYFTPAPADMLNDSFLGLSVLALAGVIWIVTLLVKDPRGVLHDELVHTQRLELPAEPPAAATPDKAAARSEASAR